MSKLWKRNAIGALILFVAWFGDTKSDPLAAKIKLTIKKNAELLNARAHWVAFHPDGTRWATALPGIIYTWHGETLTHTFENGLTQGITFSTDGKYLLASPYRFDLNHLNTAQSPDPLRTTLNTHDTKYGITASAFSTDGKQFVLVASFRPKRGIYASSERPAQPEQILLFDGESGKFKRVLWRGDSTRCQAATIGPRFIAVADLDVWLWPRHGSKTKKFVRRLFTGPEAQVRNLQFSFNGTWLAAVDADGIATLWDVASSRRLARWKVHNDNEPSLAFHPKLPLIATGSGDGAIRLWSLASVKTPILVAELANQQSTVQGLTFSPDGNRLLAAIDQRPVFFDVMIK